MRAFIIVSLLLCIGSAFAVRSHWKEQARADAKASHTITFALTQYNLDLLEVYLFFSFIYIDYLTFICL
jgi:hypothetical protein